MEVKEEPQEEDNNNYYDYFAVGWVDSDTETDTDKEPMEVLEDLNHPAASDGADGAAPDAAGEDGANLGVGGTNGAVMVLLGCV
jgi:hypothetical protein